MKHWEASIRASNRGPATPEDVDRDIAIRRNIERVFGMGYVGESEGRSPRRAESDIQPLPSPIPDERALAEARLVRSLRDSGLL